MPSGYQVVIADLSGDGRPDIVALATRQPDLVWYENPAWERHVIAAGLSRMINVAAHDIDADGRPELALAHGFTTVYDESPGIVSLLESGDDPRQPWSKREIDRAPTTHRLRWADVDGSGAQVLVNAPLIGPGSVRPDFTDTLALLWYRPADWERRGRTSVYLYRMDSRADTWSRQLLDDGGMGASGCAVHDMNADGRPDVICIGSRTANLKWYENAGR